MIDGIQITYDEQDRVVIARIDRRLFRRYNATPSEMVERIIQENQEQPTMLLWARKQVARNNRRRVGP